MYPPGDDKNTPRPRTRCSLCVFPVEDYYINWLNNGECGKQSYAYAEWTDALTDIHYLGRQPVQKLVPRTQKNSPWDMSVFQVFRVTTES